MKKSFTGAIVIAITVACVILLAEFSPANRDVLGVLAFSVLLSAPIYLLRRRYEKSTTYILEHQHEEKTESAK